MASLQPSMLLLRLYLILGGETWSTATDDVAASSTNATTTASTISDYHATMNSTGSTSPSHGIGGFQCGKCNSKFHDTEAFRGHAEKCFN